MSKFIFESYAFVLSTRRATFRYRYSDGRRFEENVTFEVAENYDKEALDAALFLAFMLIGTSYIKTFLATEIVFEAGVLDEWQSNFLNKVYQEGLGQYAYENGLTREDLPHFKATVDSSPSTANYDGEGILLLQSGGKDSLLLAAMLDEREQDYTPCYVANSQHHPQVLDSLSRPLVLPNREIDHKALKRALDDGGKNGHVPVTYIVKSLALIEAILLGKQTVLTAIAQEGEEPHVIIGDLAVTHQWSKTWLAERLFSEYVNRYVARSFRIGSPLRQFSELRVAELFVTHAWDRFARVFSSCNRANYAQGADNSELSWCGECPKCANAYLLFSAFVEPAELSDIFSGKDLFSAPSLQETFKGLLGIDGAMKPFECVGGVDELRTAYHLAQKNGYSSLPFEVPEASFDYRKEYDTQDWALQLLRT